MTSILEKIISNKRKEISLLKEQTSYNELEKKLYFARKTYSLSGHITTPEKSGIIGEFKRKSPSGGMLNQLMDVDYVANGYTNAGASGLSILTDNLFFGGSCADLLNVRDNVNIPVLRKEFILDDYQVIESKAAGADAILLIAAILNREDTIKLAALARSIDLEVLFEIHSEKELQFVNQHVNIIGVNNRNLNTLETNVNLSFSMAEKIPSDFIKISESGIDDPNTVLGLRDAGFQGFLIGENFMKRPDPTAAFIEFINKIRRNEKRHQS